MSNNDSFIDEVTEAVRRDQLFAAFRKYGWIGILAVVLLVGGAGVREYLRAQADARAQAFGDGIISAMSQDDPAKQAEALAAIATANPEQAALVALLTEGTNPGPEAAAGLEAVKADAKLPPILRDLAEFRLLLAGSDTIAAADRLSRFEALTTPGAPFRLLALEQMALIQIAEGNRDKALELLGTVSNDTGASSALRRRSGQLMVALGGNAAGN